MSLFAVGYLNAKLDQGKPGRLRDIFGYTLCLTRTNRKQFAQLMGMKRTTPPLHIVNYLPLSTTISMTTVKTEPFTKL